MLALDYLPYNNKDLMVLMKLLLGLDQPGCCRLRIFKDTGIERLIARKNEWIVSDSFLYDIKTQKDLIAQELNDMNANDDDKRFAYDLINTVEANDSFHHLNFYKRNCIHFVDYLIRLQT